MARLHPALQQGLQHLPDDRPVHLLTRHSVRELAKNGFADYRLPLTQEGVDMARSWGASLGRPVSAFYSSPVGRCVDTANAMQEGAMGEGLVAKPIECEVVGQLVEPGCFVKDIRKVGSDFLELGALGFINRHFEQPWPGMLTVEQGRTELLAYLQQRNPNPGELAVHVTHDTILALFIAALLGNDAVSEEAWPWMMEGVWVWFDDAPQDSTKAVHWVWRGEYATTVF